MTTRQMIKTVAMVDAHDGMTALELKKHGWSVQGCGSLRDAETVEGIIYFQDGWHLTSSGKTLLNETEAGWWTR